MGRRCANLTKPRIELFFCSLADAAGVDYDQVGIRVRSGGLVPISLEETGHSFAVVKVHLTAEGFKQVLTRHLTSPSLSPVSTFRFRLLPFVRQAALQPASLAPRRRPAR